MWHNLGLNPGLPNHWQTLYPLYIYIYRLIGLVSRVFTNGQGGQGSIPGRVIPKTFKKWYLMPPCLTLSIIRYVSRVKWSNPRKGVAPSLIPQCSSYWKGSFWVTLDSTRQLYLLIFRQQDIIQASFVKIMEYCSFIIFNFIFSIFLLFF